MDDLVRGLQGWAKELEMRERLGEYLMDADELYSLSILLECAADILLNLRGQRELALAKARAASYGR